VTKKYQLVTLRYCNQAAGIGAIAKEIVNWILATDEDKIPFVDLKNYETIYYKDGRKKLDNVWEYFFKQPNDIGLNDISSDVEIVEKESSVKKYTQNNFFTKHLPTKEAEITSEIIAKKEAYKKYLVFCDEMQKYAQEKYEKIIGNQKVLGICCRGTDYLSLKPINHPIQPKPKDVLKMAKKIYRKHNFDKIFLATEDMGIYQMFKKEFKDVLLDNNQYRFPSKVSKWIAYENKNEEIKDFRYNLAKNYLTSLYILGKCEYFIGGRTSGTVLAYIFSDSWKKFYIWNLGVYKNRLGDLKKLLIVLKYKLFN